ncbi:MAG: glycosyl transferase family 2 [Frankiales bacterium]|nr:glycosyl transferase family 2 [Frankiales bacterium]
MNGAGMSGPRLTVVVPTRDRPAHLAGCLAALRPQLHADDELLVVDSASRVPVPDALRVDLAGASRARNAGWRAASGELVAFLDDDVRVAPGWRRAVETAVEGVAFACGRVAVPPSQEGGERPVAVTPDVPETLLDSRSHEVLGVSANLVVRREVLRAVGGFDDRLGPGTWFCAAEDVVLLDRLLAAGHVGRYAPVLLAHHEQWRGRRDLLRLDWGYGKGAGARAVLAGGSRGRRLARTSLWEQALQPVPGDVRRGYGFGVATGLVRAGGTLVGLAAARARL